jgi:hypothetical protein
MTDKPTLYDRILEYLFDRQDEKGYVNLFNDDFKDVDRILLREKVGELARAERIDRKVKLRIVTGSRTPRERWEDNNLLEVEYVTELRKNRKPTETKKIEVKAEQIGTLNLGDIENKGEFNQSSNNNLIKPTTPDKTNPTPTNNIMKAITKRTVEIIVGIIIIVGGALIIWKITGQV